MAELCTAQGQAGVCLGDWLQLAPMLVPASVDFCYADPPFNTGEAKATPPNALRAGREVATAYCDRWGSTTDYMEWLRGRVGATLPALKPTGVLAIHCDWRTSHHVRLMLDELMGEANFVNQLVWRYGLGGSSPRRFARKHDDVIVYAMDVERYFFEPPMVAATSQRMRGRMKKSTDVLDVPSLNNMARERTGYPTQKPVALLELLVGAFAPAGGLVLDPCCGSGTTLVAAKGLGRRAIGFDMNPRAVELARKRLGEQVEPLAEA
ncbi:MAG: site-specific DNA-methyltransferase [Planctomycetota bacterium]|nr:site-specific DNA-methyltransferase [Planctomycetota bacterium]